MGAQCLRGAPVRNAPTMSALLTSCTSSFAPAPQGTEDKSSANELPLSQSHLEGATADNDELMSSAEEPVSDEPVLDKPISDEPISDEPISDDHVSDEQEQNEEVVEAYGGEAVGASQVEAELNTQAVGEVRPHSHFPCNPVNMGQQEVWFAAGSQYRGERARECREEEKEEKEPSFSAWELGLGADANAHDTQRAQATQKEDPRGRQQRRVRFTSSCRLA